MRYIRKNKFAFVLLLTAVLSLAGFAIGGEYLHSHVHKHESQTAHQQCPIYQLQTQVFTTVGIVIAALFSAVIFTEIVRRSNLFVFQPNYILPESHAPPFSLS